MAFEIDGSIVDILSLITESKILLSSGTYSDVHKIGKDGALVLKIESDHSEAKKFIKQEIKIFEKHVSHITHPNIIKYYHWSELCYNDGTSRFSIVLEHIDGHDLHSCLTKVKGGSLSESESKHLFKQMLGAVSILHQNLVAHRDLKLENFMVTKDLQCVKLIDFGFAKKLSNANQKFDECMGSIAYAAPEVIRGIKHDPILADIWSLGVCLYTMLFYAYPFWDDDIQLAKEKILTYDLKFPSTHPDVSQMCRDFIKDRFIQRDCNKRMPLSKSLQKDDKSWLSL